MRWCASGWRACPTYPKGASRTATIGGTRVTLNGIAKGSGMLAPDMATMLAFIFTDAAIPAGVRQGHQCRIPLLTPAAWRPKCRPETPTARPVPATLVLSPARRPVSGHGVRKWQATW